MKTYRVPLYLLMALITAVSLFAGLFHGIAFFHRRLLNESLHPIVDLLSALVTVTAISLLFLVFRKYHRVIASLKTALAERKHAEEELTRVYGMTKTVIDNMNDAVSLIDVRNFRIVGVNSVFLKEYGQSDESEVLGKPCYEVTHHRRDICSPPDDICPLAETVRTGEHFTAEHVHYGKNGERIYVEVSTSPIK
ncbi:MAG TPA: PAS domain-containing protein, partial [Dissulfurispiraceae bacterium]